MGKIISKKVSERMNPYNGKKMQYGGIADMNTSSGKGGFIPPADETSLGTMNSIMSEKYNKK